MFSNTSTIRRMHSITRYECNSGYDSACDLDDDSLSWEQSDKHIGSNYIHTFPKAQPQPLSSRAPPQVASSRGSYDIAISVELDIGGSLERKLSCCSFAALQNWSASEYPETKEVKKSPFSTCPTAASTCASSTIHSNPSSSDHTFTSSVGFVPSAVIFADQCLNRSYERRSSYDFCISSPSDLSFDTSEGSVQATPLVTSQKSSAVVPYPSISRESIPRSTTALHKSSTTAQVLDTLLDETSQSSHSFRVQKIKRKLRMTEIQYYRRKCVWSSRKYMAHYMNLNPVSTHFTAPLKIPLTPIIVTYLIFVATYLYPIIDNILRYIGSGPGKYYALTLFTTACMYFFMHSLHKLCTGMYITRLMLG